MKIELVWDETALRALKKWRKKHPDLMPLFEKRLLQFCEEPFHPSLRTHSLTGNLQGYWAFSINYQYRLVFTFLSESEALIINVGTHDEVY